MKPLLRSAALLAVATAGLLPAPAPALAAAPAPTTGAPYVLLDHPQPVRDASHQEAIEFFWYDCEHSAQFEEPLEQWAARHRADVTLRRVPAVWPGGPSERIQSAHARLYYSLERLGEVDRLQQAAFQAIHREHLDLTTEDRAADWAARHGVDGARFRAAYESPEVARATSDAPVLFRRYEVAELPTVVVGGRYRTGPSRAGGVDRMPAVLDRLVALR